MNTAATSLGDFLDYPSSPSLSQKDLDPVRSGEHITLIINYRSKSRIVDGHLMRFDMNSEVVDVILQDHWDFSSFDFAEISYLILTRPRLVSEAEEVNHGIKVRHYDVELLSQEKLTGKTLPVIEDEKGLFLFPVDDNLHYHCLFIPKTSLKSGYQLGALETLNGIKNEDKSDDLAKHINLINNIQDLEMAVKNQPVAPQVKLGQLLIRENLLTEKQLENALEYQSKHRNRPLGKILTQMGIISDAEIQLALTRKLGIPFVNLQEFELDMEVVNQLPQAIIRKHKVLPIHRKGNEIIIALENPLDKEAISAASFNTKLHVETVIASGSQLEARINDLFGAQAIDFSLDELDSFETLESDSEREDSDEVGENDNTILRLANKIIIDAYRKGASDIHIEPYPQKQKAIVRFRVDGVLTDYVEIPTNLRKPLVSRYKIMAGLDISERRKPQDGKINFKRYSNTKLELRVATIPTVGDIEDVVMRLLADSKPKAINDLGLTSSNQAMIEKMLEIPYGLVLVCGPTGSGKTTTLHSLLSKLNTGDRKIWTAEDPVEITQRGLRQVQVNPKIEFTFASAMRSFLRADPDIIMVGEMRDQETAKIGIEASLTGHLVLSTLHTNSAPESIVRLLDMGMDPFNFAYSLIGVVAQRLARTLCKKCKQAQKVGHQDLHDLAIEYLQHDFADGIDQASKELLVKQTLDQWQETFGDNDGEVTTYVAIGCDECDHTGYRGRIALHEVLANSDDLRRLIREGASVSELQHTCINTGMKTLKQDGITKFLKGDTDMLQVRKVCIT